MSTSASRAINTATTLKHPFAASRLAQDDIVAGTRVHAGSSQRMGAQRRTRPVCRVRISFGSDASLRETADFDFLFANMISKVCRRASSLAGGAAGKGGERDVECVRDCAKMATRCGEQPLLNRTQAPTGLAFGVSELFYDYCRVIFIRLLSLLLVLLCNAEQQTETATFAPRAVNAPPFGHH